MSLLQDFERGGCSMIDTMLQNRETTVDKFIVCKISEFCSVFGYNEHHMYILVS